MITKPYLRKILTFLKYILIISIKLKFFLALIQVPSEHGLENLFSINEVFIQIEYYLEQG